MPINELQQNILIGTFNFIYESIRESAPPTITKIAFAAFFDDQIYHNSRNKEEFEKYQILSLIEKVREIFKYDFPQNRNESYPYVGQVAGYAMYAIAEKDIDRSSNDPIKLFNGIEIDKKNIIRNIPQATPNATALVAMEPLGALGLTVFGPITKEELINFIKQKSAEEINSYESEFKESFDDIANGSSRILAALSNPFGEQENNIAINELAKLTSQSIAFKKFVFTNIKHILFEEAAIYEQQLLEEDSDYVKRIENSINYIIHNHVTHINEANQMKEERHKKMDEIENEMKHLNAQLKKIKDDAFATSWPTKATEADKRQQWMKLLSSTANYRTNDFKIKNMIPDESILDFIKKYKDMEKKIALKLREKNQNLAPSDKFFLSFSQHDETNKLKNKLYGYLNEFRLGNFSNQDEFISTTKALKLKNGFAINLTDRHGKNALYYALNAQNNLFAYDLIVEQKATVSSYHKKLAGLEPQVLKALGDSSIDGHQVWYTILLRDAEEAINKIILDRDSKGLQNLKAKYKKYGWGDVYTGSEFINIIDTAVNYHLRKLNMEFYLYLKCNDISNEGLGFYKEIYKVLDKLESFRFEYELYEWRNKNVLAKAQLESSIDNAEQKLQENKVTKEDSLEQMRIVALKDFLLNFELLLVNLPQQNNTIFKKVDPSSKARISLSNSINSYRQRINERKDEIFIPALVKEINNYKQTLVENKSNDFIDELNNFLKSYVISSEELTEQSLLNALTQISKPIGPKF